MHFSQRPPRAAFSSLLGFALSLAAAGCSREVPALTSRQGDTPRSPVAGDRGASLAAGSGGGTAAIPGSPGQPIPIMSSAGTAATVPADGSCARGMQTTNPVTPTVWLVVDGSRSMDDELNAGRSRWEALRATLMDAGGVVDSLQSLVRFGMVIYSGVEDDSDGCTQLVTVAPELDNLPNLLAQYPVQPLGPGTPTDKALDYVVNNLAVTNTITPDARSGPIYVVLATDGQPNDSCEVGGGRGMRGGSAVVEQRVVDVTARGTAAGMNMFVISLAGADPALQSHLAAVADATVTKTVPFVPATQDDLIESFRKIVGTATCQVALDGSVEQGRECTGEVRLNGNTLACNDPNGWMLLDPRTVQLSGSACTNFTSQQSLVNASFPCDVFTPG